MKNINRLIQLDWKEFLIGNPYLDAQHAELINTINRLYKARFEFNHKEVEIVLFSLLDSARFHFHEEEKELMSKKYPRYIQHAIEHQDLLIRAQEFLVKLRDEKRDYVKEIIELELEQFLFDWFQYHARVSDVDAEKFMK